MPSLLNPSPRGRPTLSAQSILEENPHLQGVIAQVGQVAVLPHVVFKVLELSGDVDAPSSEIERAIVVDPGFSARVLAIANSSYYGLPKKVTSIHEAVMFLGLKTLRELAMTAGIFDMFIGKTDRESLRRRTWWRQSIDAAVCGRWLARSSGKMSDSEAYTAGLLHLIGKSLLERFGSGDYSKVEFLVANGVDDLRSEAAVYGCDHISVGIGAGRQWGFPEALLASLDYRAAPEGGDEFRHGRAVVAVGSKIATLAMGGDPTPPQEALPHWALEILGYSVEDADDIVAGGTEAIVSAGQFQL